MNQFLIGLVERAALRAPVLERRARSLFEPIAPAMGGAAAIEGGDEAVAIDPDGHLASALRDEPASRGARERPSGGDPVERWQRGETSPGMGAPRWNERAEDAGSHATRAAREEARPVPVALDRGALEANAEAEPLSVSVGPVRPAEAQDPRGELGAPAWNVGSRADDGPPPVFAASISHRDLETAARLAKLLTAGPAERPRRDPSAELGVLSAGRLPSRAAEGDALPTGPRAPGVGGARVDLATVAPVPTASGGAPATIAPLLRSGPRVPGPPALLVQSQRPASFPRIGGTAAAATPPPVHVTIGRLEVRANAPAAERPPARRSSAGPKLSLEDYLQGRRGGAR